MKQGNYLKMSILGDLNIDPKKHKEKQTQKKRPVYKIHQYQKLDKKECPQELL